jgi:hypothetical protein
MDQDLKTIGLSLSSGMITLPEALKWLEEVGAMPLIGAIPEAVRAAAAAVDGGQKALAKGAQAAREERRTSR